MLKTLTTLGLILTGTIFASSTESDPISVTNNFSNLSISSNTTTAPTVTGLSTLSRPAFQSVSDNNSNSNASTSCSSRESEQSISSGSPRSHRAYSLIKISAQHEAAGAFRALADQAIQIADIDKRAALDDEFQKLFTEHAKYQFNRFSLINLEEANKASEYFHKEEVKTIYRMQSVALGKEFLDPYQTNNSKQEDNSNDSKKNNSKEVSEDDS